MFTYDQRYNITKNNYRQGLDQLTLNGLRNEYTQGEVFKDLYITQNRGFLSKEYNPSEYFVRSYPDNPSVMSAYAFLLGTDPKYVEGIGLIQEKGAIPPLSNAQVDDTRRALYLSKNEDKAKPAYVYSGNSDGFFFKDIQSMYPGIQRDFEKNIHEASVEYQSKTKNRLFEVLSNQMNVPASEITFYSLAKYLDDYICAYSNERSTIPFNFDKNTEEMVSEYFTYLIKHGMLRDQALNKVIAHPFLYSLLREIMFKAQPQSEFSKWEGPWVTSKASLSFGNRLTFLAALEVLNLDQDINYVPGWGDQLTFELFEEDRKLFIRIFINQKLVTQLSRDGVIPLNQFIDYVCSRLYYGDLDAVEKGTEDYHAMANVIGQCHSLTQVVPLFGWTKKKQYTFEQNNNYQYGWVQDSLRKNDKMTNYGNGKWCVDNSIIFTSSSNPQNSNNVIKSSLQKSFIPIDHGVNLRYAQSNSNYK